MPLAMPRMRLAFLLLATALLLVAAAVVVSLVSLNDPVLAAIVAVAGAVGVLGSVFAYVVSREDEEPVPAGERELVAQPAIVPAAVHRPEAATVTTLEPPTLTRMQALPIADLPPAYLAAVMKGVHANRTAQQARVLPSMGLRH